ncbi:uncharacterized protein METZ01_LOCUS514541, partial [marine metagenome]
NIYSFIEMEIRHERFCLQTTKFSRVLLLEVTKLQIALAQLYQTIRRYFY